MNDGGTDLGFNVISNNRNSSILEPLAPFRVRCYKDRHAVNESHACIQGCLSIEAGGLLRAHRHVVHKDIGSAVH
ncbi:Uncharacterised protein [uncultured archaeon]|nr:Uncharacterised protein [uncultured archaeon]